MALHRTPTAHWRRSAALAVLLILGIAGLPIAGKWVALAAIEEYQEQISPLKGYRCAYAALHGRSTCSAYGKRVIREQGLWCGVRLLRERFRECRAAAKTLGEQRSPTRPGSAPPSAPAL